MIAHCIASLPEELRGMFWSNIVCVGGNSGFPGFVPRLYVSSRPSSSRPSLMTSLAANESCDPSRPRATMFASSLHPRASFSLAPGTRSEAFLCSPTLSTILSASAALAANPRLQESFISRAEYQEGGSNAVRRKFGKLYYSDQALREDLDGTS